jgi:two-component system, chemotaxis family, response regulator Rcp1
MNPEKTGPRKPFVLIAEDNPADVGLIRLALQKHGVESELHVIPDGEAAVRFIESVESDATADCPQLAIVDLNLPRLGGDEILRRVRSSKKWQQVPVIVMSSSLSSRDRNQALERGADAYFPKPSDLEQFLMLGELVKSKLPPSNPA